MARFRYPPCNLNPVTEKPYIRHKWVIPATSTGRVVESKNGPITRYRVVCSRCGIKDPNPPLY